MVSASAVRRPRRFMPRRDDDMMRLGLALAAAVVILDQASKVWLISWLESQGGWL